MILPRVAQLAKLAAMVEGVGFDVSVCGLRIFFSADYFVMLILTDVIADLQGHQGHVSARAAGTSPQGVPL